MDGKGGPIFVAVLGAICRIHPWWIRLPYRTFDYGGCKLSL